MSFKLCFMSSCLLSVRLYSLQMHIHELLMKFIKNAIAFSASPLKVIRSYTGCIRLYTCFVLGAYAACTWAELLDSVPSALVRMYVDFTVAAAARALKYLHE